jgi:hypothetical protein
MESTRSHFSKVHEHFHKHHATLAEHHEGEADRHKAAGNKEDAAHHAFMAKHHHSSAAFHKSCAEAMKAAEAADLNKNQDRELSPAIQAAINKAILNTIRPDNISSTIPSDVPFGIRSVTRHGQPDAIDKSLIPPQFQHLVEFHDEL